MMPLGVLASARAAAGASLTLAWAGIVSEANPTSTTTFPTVQTGTAASDRTVLVTIAASGGSASAVTALTVTIGGVAATVDGFTVAASGFMATAHVALPTGTTAAVVVTQTGGWASRIIVGSWSVTGGTPVYVANARVSYADTAAHTLTTASQAGGFVVAHTIGGNGAKAWTDVTSRWDQLLEAWSSGADATTTGATHGVTVQESANAGAAYSVQAVTFGV